MPRGISPATIKFFDEVRAEVRRFPYKYNQTQLATKMGVTQSKMNKMIRGFPWFEAFDTNTLGAIGLSGVDIATEYPSLNLKSDKEIFPDDPNVVELGFKAGSPFPDILKAARAHIAKAQGRSYIKDDLLSGFQIARRVHEAEHFNIQLTRQITTIKSKPNYGKPEWWLDYLDKL